MNLSPLSEASKPLLVPPRPGFRAAVPPLYSVSMEGTWFGMPGQTAAQKAGLRYEEKVGIELKKKYGDYFTPGPRFHFREDKSPRTCVPDGLFVFDSKIVVVECKSQHMPESWWQLRKLYQPVLNAWLPRDGRPVQVLEICRVYDAGMPFPEKVNLIYDLESWLHADIDPSFGVFVWKM